MTMTAGDYYIGDLCYVMTDEEWDEVCALTIKDNKCLEGEFTLSDGRQFAMYGTAYGDGTYNDQYLHNYNVDSGTIGCMLISDIKKDLSGESIEQLGARVKFDYPFSTSGGRHDRDWDGEICIGALRIITNPEINEDGYDPWS